jgi:hybrid cluster-associated redox disulfide protein
LRQRKDKLSILVYALVQRKPGLRLTMDYPLDPKTTIAELMEKWPPTIAVFMKYRMYCVGCSMAAFDTLEQVVEIYPQPKTTFLEDLKIATRAPATKT